MAPTFKTTIVEAGEWFFAVSKEFKKNQKSRATRLRSSFEVINFFRSRMPAGCAWKVDSRGERNVRLTMADSDYSEYPSFEVTVRSGDIEVSIYAVMSLNDLMTSILVDGQRVYLEMHIEDVYDSECASFWDVPVWDIRHGIYAKGGSKEDFKDRTGKEFVDEDYGDDLDGDWD